MQYWLNENIIKSIIKVRTQLQMLYCCWLDQDIAPPTFLSLAPTIAYYPWINIGAIILTPDKYATFFIWNFRIFLLSFTWNFDPVKIPLAQLFKELKLKNQGIQRLLHGEESKRNYTHTSIMSGLEFESFRKPNPFENWNFQSLVFEWSRPFEIRTNKMGAILVLA